MAENVLAHAPLSISAQLFLLNSTVYPENNISTILAKSCQRSDSSCFSIIPYLEELHLMANLEIFFNIHIISSLAYRGLVAA